MEFIYFLDHNSRPFQIIFSSFLSPTFPGPCCCGSERIFFSFCFLRASPAVRGDDKRSYARTASKNKTHDICSNSFPLIREKKGPGGPPTYSRTDESCGTFREAFFSQHKEQRKKLDAPFFLSVSCIRFSRVIRHQSHPRPSNPSHAHPIVVSLPTSLVRARKCEQSLEY